MNRRGTALLLALLLAPGAGRDGTAAQRGRKTSADPRITSALRAVSEVRLRSLVGTLVGFGTRNTLSDTQSESHGIGAARQWILEELRRSSPRLQVGYEIYRLAAQGRITRELELRNVVAVLPGRSTRRVYVTAHYDSLVTGPDGANAANIRPAGEPAPPDPLLRVDQDYDVPAPGANDNGSGTALTMEVARVLAGSGIDFDATLVFVLWAGEEQGLFGARLHARRLFEEKAVVEGVFNNDVVGNSRAGNGVTRDNTVRVYSEGPADSKSRALARFVKHAAETYLPSYDVRLLARQDRFGRRSDHAAFNQHGYPAIVFREASEDFARQHSTADTVDGVNFTYLAKNTRLNVAAAAVLALAPSAPGVLNERGQHTIGRQPTGYEAHLRWNASPGATAYRIYWRDAWTPDWQRTRQVGNVTDYTFPAMNIDDYVFGVAAIGADGHESVVSTYVATTRRDEDVKLAP